MIGENPNKWPRTTVNNPEICSILKYLIKSELQKARPGTNSHAVRFVTLQYGKPPLLSNFFNPKINPKKKPRQILGTPDQARHDHCAPPQQPTTEERQQPVGETGCGLTPSRKSSQPKRCLIGNPPKIQNPKIQISKTQPLKFQKAKNPKSKNNQVGLRTGPFQIPTWLTKNQS